MGLQTLNNRALVSYVRPHAFVHKTQAILARLGYPILSSEEFAVVREESHESAAFEPRLLIVDEHRLGEVMDRHEEPVADAPPIILLTGRRGLGEDHVRVVAAIKRPAGLHDLYRLLQQYFEETPRSTPRVRTQLPVRCGRDGREWSGSLVSLSENGALLQSAEALPLGSRFDLRFELPNFGQTELSAEAAYQLVPDLGVVFSGLAPAARTAIGEFVSDTILG